MENIDEDYDVIERKKRYAYGQLYTPFIDCPDCKGRLIVEGDHIYCKRCGLIVDDGLFYDYVEYEGMGSPYFSNPNSALLRRKETKLLTLLEKKKILFNRRK